VLFLLVLLVLVLVLVLLLLLFYRLISAAADWISTLLPHMVWPTGFTANLECTSQMCCTRLAEMQNPQNRQNSPSGHHRTTLSGYLFATKACIDNQKKMC